MISTGTLPARIARREIVGKETVVKRIFFALTALVCFGASASQAQAQYQQPYGRISQPQAMRSGYQQPQRPAYGVQQTAMRPSTNTYAATPASGFALKPINPPSPATQRLLMASRNQPTPAPAQARSAQSGPMAQPQSNVRLPPSQAASNWGPPPSGGYDSGAYGGSQQYGGGMGAAPVGAQPDGGYGGPVADGGAAPCNGGQCGGDSCGFGGCCRLGLPSLGCCLGGHTSCFCTTGDLVQHTPFFGTTHGYYYFRPYHVMHVFSQQELATRWGADPRNPYDNTIFQRTYEAMGVDAVTIKAREEAAAKQKAANLADPPTVVPSYSLPPDAVPTPLPGGYQGTMNYGPQGNMYPPQGSYAPQGGFQGGMVPQGSMPNVPAPSIEYVPNR